MVGGFACSRTLEVHGERMLDSDFTPGFRARLHEEDPGIVTREAQRIGLGLPSSALAAQLMNALVGSGHGEEDSAAVLRIIAGMSGQTLD